MTDVVVDLGKTRCRARSDDGVAEAPGSPGLASPAGVLAALASIAGAVREAGAVRAADAVGAADAVRAGDDGRIGRIAVGAAGALTDPVAAEQLAQRLSAEYGGPQVAVTSDALTAHLGALAGAGGVVVVAGTGAVAVAVDDDGKVAVADGLGPVDGDLGSGGWIGAEMIARAAAYGRWADVVARRIGRDWRELVGDRSYEHVRLRASLVPDLAALARSGDADAIALVEEAAGALASTASEAAGQVGDVREVAVVGGLTGLGPLLIGPLGEALGDLRLRAAVGDALDGAALLLDRNDLPHEAHVHRA
ncbi:BadF/BadG/BcrA/BcrD ATPase family protein [Luteipulveratus sp. YIM 133132]|uniref:BadF/BadG/BcrA/BcrD ATPase family protein n=1 Tax=Luteipulveratus flavus TaxID=3031728 RepID=UPI0023AE8443|nr:BadF/BadG/BcrA/BcrD ATPase family protein [Luteipulveratus sp. YIM 133132]MDE9366548.1 BadF/BadG/BcrA/BcrD ATPase family protein [Luteipulveratus sp. YIM 133132]